MPLSAALSRVTWIAAGSISVAVIVAAGHRWRAAKASSPVPVPRSMTLAKVRSAMPSSIARHPEVVAWCPVPNACPASIRKARPPGGAATGCALVWTTKRPSRIGSSPAWLIATQSSAPSGVTTGAIPAALGASAASAASSAASGSSST